MGFDDRRGIRSLLALAGMAGAAWLAGSAHAGGTGENAVLIIDPSDPVSMWLGNYYKNARSIPDCNVLYMDPGATNFAQFVATNLAGLAGHVANRGIDDHADFVLIAPTDQFYVPASGILTDGCFPVNRFSLSTAYSLAFITADVVPGTPSTMSNRYFGTGNSMVAFDSNVTWAGGVASTNATARRYYIGGMIGYTGTRGNTAQEIIAMIDRTLAVEGARPAGTFYFMNNTVDPDRNVRQVQYTAVMNALNSSTLGMTAVQQNDKIPWGHQDCMGIVTGFPNTDVVGSNIAVVPGSYCDHLTSYGATYDEGSQTKVSQWIIKGCAASAGTVEEPCNYLGKFTHSRLHVYYAQGGTVGEAYFRSMQYVPFQSLLVGDVLARPFAYVPAVDVTGLPAGYSSGLVVLTPTAITGNTRAAIAGFDLLIDGLQHSSAAVGGTFSVDTTALSDGWHDVRVIARDNQPNKTQGRWTGSMVVLNQGRSAGIFAGVTTGNMSTLLAFDVSASGAPVREIRLVHNGRVVATRHEAGPIQVRGRTLGAGPSTVRAVAMFVDGRTVSSAPIAVNLDPAAPPVAPEPPIAYGYTARVLANQNAVVELPAVFAEDPAAATFAITGLPAQSAIIGGTGAYRIISTNPTATGSDRIVFRTTTPAGVSADAIVTLLYGSGCPADFNNDGAVDFFDYDEFVNCFEGSSCPPGTSADFNADGAVDFFDYDEFVVSFEYGC
ncbi:MAG: TIGR03790 family protein [Planctomycetota bacterium]